MCWEQSTELQDIAQVPALHSEGILIHRHVSGTRVHLRIWMEVFHSIGYDSSDWYISL